VGSLGCGSVDTAHAVDGDLLHKQIFYNELLIGRFDRRVVGFGKVLVDGG